MAFVALILTAELGARQIGSVSEALAFISGLDLAKQNVPHWQMARQALYTAPMSKAAEDRAWREFRNALINEGWLSG